MFANDSDSNRDNMLFWPLKHQETREFEGRLGRIVVEPWRRGQTRKSLLDIQPHAFLLALVCFVRSFACMRSIALYLIP
jgi:hypothetical protein